jgi:hypothetical protein
MPELDQDERSGRNIDAYWRSAEAETVEEIAGRLRKLVQRLTALGLPAADLRPWTERRALRTSDPTVMHLSVADLGHLIDRKARFDAPPLPAPVSEEGYSLLLSDGRSRQSLDRITLNLHAASIRPRMENQVLLNLHGRNPIWADEARCREALQAIIETWSPERAVIRTAEPFNHDASHAWLCRYWMCWSKAGLELASFPRSRPSEDAGAAVEPWLGGTLAIWAHEGGLGAPGVWPG